MGKSHVAFVPPQSICCFVGLSWTEEKLSSLYKLLATQTPEQDRSGFISMPTEWKERKRKKKKEEEEEKSRIPNREDTFKRYALRSVQCTL